MPIEALETKKDMIIATTKHRENDWPLAAR